MDEIENPKGSQTITANKELTGRRSSGKIKLEDITQIRPQKLTLKLRSGISIGITKSNICFNVENI